MSAWSEFKKKQGTTRPWHAMQPSKQVKDEETANKRYGICVECPSLIRATKQCKECGCFMVIKTKIAEATCPLGKW